ncbi:MAG TPA: type II toxin-antitoxin system RelE/ParE family toxin [Caulobacteraceae bacterium]
MVQVIWTRRALSDITSIRSYVAAFAPRAAERLAQRLLAAGESLAVYPDRGRPVGRSRRELTVVWPYLLRYQLSADRIEIMSVRHGARRRASVR